MEQFIVAMVVIYLAIGVFCAFANRRYWKMQAEKHPDIARYLLQDQWVDFVFESITQPIELIFSPHGRRAFFHRLGTDKVEPCTSEMLVPGLHAGKVGRSAEHVTSCRECGDTFPLADAGYISNRRNAGPLCPECFDRWSKPLSYWQNSAAARMGEVPSLEELIGKDLTRH